MAAKSIDAMRIYRQAVEAAVHTRYIAAEEQARRRQARRGAEEHGAVGYSRTHSVCIWRRYRAENLLCAARYVARKGEQESAAYRRAV